MNSYDVRFWKIEPRKDRQDALPGPLDRRRAAVQRIVRHHGARRVVTAPQLITRPGTGRASTPRPGLPESMVRTAPGRLLLPARAEFAAAAWPVRRQDSRVSIIETLTRVVPVVAPRPGGRSRPCRAAARAAQDPQPGRATRASSPENEAKAIAWLDACLAPGQRARRTRAVVCDVLDALAVNLDGKPAAPDTSPAAAGSCTGARLTRCARSG